MSSLYIVATPIGNMEDMTLRAIRVLNEVDMVLAEDTRNTGKLLKRHGIEARLKSYHQQSSEKVAEDIITLLEEGKTLALVTDAGTPGIADPGNELIAKILDALPETKIEPVPGASSLTAALSVCGFPTNEFVFLGFLPHKKGRQTMLNEIAEMKRTIVLFESPHRIQKLFSELTERIPERKCAVFRETTKLHESRYRGSIQEVAKMTIPTKGEFVVVIGPVKI
jgi:16S rRNA (cytidine1402-2'-O)-methyltransferase